MAIDRFTLITAPNGIPVMNITDGMTIDVGLLASTALSIEVVPSPAVVGSVGLVHNGQIRAENIVPYTLGGDEDGIHNSANLTIGSHTLTATPFSGPNLSGNAGTPKTIAFTVVNNSIQTPTPLPVSLNLTGALTVEEWIKSNIVLRRWASSASATNNNRGPCLIAVNNGGPWAGHSVN
jgi:hypothetical protein